MSESYYYNNHLPEKDELVMARISEISEIGVTCVLLEYNNITAFLSFSEISRKNCRSVYNLVKVGQKYIFQVTSVTNNNVDLSKKFLDPDEITFGQEKYKKGKFVYNICKYISELKNASIQEVYDSLIPPLYDDYDYPYDAFKLLVSGINIYENCNVNEEYLSELKILLGQQMTVHPVKISALVDVTCINGGINVIKHALLTAQNSVPKEFNIEIQSHGTPTFLIFTTTLDGENGILAVNNVAECIKKEIIKNNGDFVLKKAAHILQ